MEETRRLESFRQISREKWEKMQRPYIAVSRLRSDSEYGISEGMCFMAHVYDGAADTGLFRLAEDVDELYKDIAENFPELEIYMPGTDDSELLICVFA